MQGGESCDGGSEWRRVRWLKGAVQRGEAREAEVLGWVWDWARLAPAPAQYAGAPEGNYEIYLGLERMRRSLILEASELETHTQGRCSLTVYSPSKESPNLFHPDGTDLNTSDS